MRVCDVYMSKSIPRLLKHRLTGFTYARCNVVRRDFLYFTFVTDSQ